MALSDAVPRLFRPTPRTATALDEDTVYDLLSNDRRRWAIEHLSDIDEPTTVRELARARAFIESDADHPDEIGTTDYKRYYVSFYQTHLPTLEDHGVVEVNRAGTVRAIRPTCHRLAAIAAEVRAMNGGPVR